MIVSDIAALLVVAGAILAGILDDWAGLPFALSGPLLGVSLLAFSTLGPVEGAAALATTSGVVAIVAGGDFSGFRQVRRDFQVRWFNLSATLLAVVGASGLAMQRPLFGSAAVGIVGNVLFFCGLLHSVTGRPARLSSGLLFLFIGATVLFENDGQAIARGDVLLLDAVQIFLALALTYLHISDQRAADHESASDSESSVADRAATVLSSTLVPPDSSS
ncbi:MAG TPA: hypothetical protein VNG11_04585 [Chloroflexota bacterium]|nr:hypothetical protein [Chloroflexota bacterium]